MEDEVSKHGKKIYHTIKSPKHSFGEKVKDILVEIFIIVFAVTISIWLHSWSDHNHEQKEAREFLTGLKGDLNKDIQLLEENKNVIAGLDSNFHLILSLRDSNIATDVKNKIITEHFYFYLRVTHPSIGRYEGFKSSGKIGTIEDDNLKQDILEYYQQIIPDVAYGESYVNELQSKILNQDINKEDKMTMSEFTATGKMQGLLGLGIQNFEVNLDAYNNAIKHAKKVVVEIDKAIKH